MHMCHAPCYHCGLSKAPIETPHPVSAVALVHKFQQEGCSPHTNVTRAPSAQNWFFDKHSRGSQYPQSMQKDLTAFSCSHRAVVEERALRFGRRLLLEQFDTITDVVRQAEKQRHDGKKPFFEFSASSTDRIGSHSLATAVEP